MINVGIVGVGNVASMLIQGVEYYRRKHNCNGLIHCTIDGYKVSDIRFVYAIDVSKNKVGKDLSEAIFAKPNIVPRYVRLKELGVKVRMGKVLDGVAPHMIKDFEPLETMGPSLRTIVKELRENNVDVLINLLPVGSSKATRFYVKAAALAKVAFINGIPEFIASSRIYSRMFEKNKALVLGDDIKGQLGATIVHRVLASLISIRGSKIKKTYQLNVGGNSDFKNMLEQSRLKSKRKSKTLAIASTHSNLRKLMRNIFAGPSGYVEFLGNTKVAYIYIEAESFMNEPVIIDLKLVVNDKAMAASVLIDVTRLAKALKERGIHGSPGWASTPYFKHPPIIERSDYEALKKFYTNLEKLGIKIEPRRITIQ